MARFSDDESSRDSSLVYGEYDGVDTNRKRNLDRRRETSRYAARDRRGKEADIFSDLKDVVPIVEESTVTHVDRIALLRVASTMCRMRRNAGKFLETELPQEDPQIHCFTEQNMTECLDGFVLLADSDGTILYVSESVSIFLGLTQTDLVGRFLKEFVHSNDYDELIRASTTSTEVQDTASSLDEFGRYIVVRMKTVISPRGRNLNLKSALFKAILCRFRAVNTEYGRLSLLYGSSTPAGQGNSIMLANASVKGSEATNGVYMTRHTCDMRFSYVSDSLNYLLRHDARSLMGTSFYDIVHPSDMIPVAESMKELFQKGHCRTPFYRLLGSNSSVAWVQTEATTVNHTARGQKGQYVLCVHSVVGMQSELDAWSEPVVDGQMAAHPAICVSKIKHEIPDMAEYMGKQPEFVDCVDFTPLIEPIIDINYDDYSNMNGMRGHEKRKKSFDEVLDWLVRDEAESPPPYASFFDHNDECRADPTSSSEYNSSTFRPQQFGGYQQTQFERMSYGNGLGQTSAAPVAARDRFECGATNPTGPLSGAGRPSAGPYAADGQNYSAMQRGSARVQQSQQGFKAEARNSRFAAHMRREIGIGQPSDLLRQGQSAGAGARGAAPLRARSASSRAVPATAASDVYLMSGAQLGSAARRFPAGSPLHTAMRAACDPKSPSYTRASSTSSSRSTFDSAAVRRYAQASPSPRHQSQSGRSRCSSTCSGIGGTPKPREQRPVNVNQLSAVSTAVVHPLDSPPQGYQEQYNKFEFNEGPVCKKAAFGTEKPVYKDEYGRDFAGLAPFVPEEDFLQLEDLDLKGVFPDVDFSEFFPDQSSSNPGSAGSLPMMDQQKRTPPCFDDMFQQNVNIQQQQESIVPDNWRMTESELW